MRTVASGWGQAASWRRPVIVLPLLGVLAAVVYLGVGMVLRPPAPHAPEPADTSSTGQVNASVPSFDLPPLVAGQSGLADRDLAGHVTVVNFFASWCAPCRIEAPTLASIGTHARLVGVDFRDEPTAAVSWLGQTGVPFQRVGADRDGKVGVAWGVLGLPATFVIDRHGRIRYRHLGLLTRDQVNGDILPLLHELGQG